jgi:hypothetical protein
VVPPAQPAVNQIWSGLSKPEVDHQPDRSNWPVSAVPGTRYGLELLWIPIVFKSIERQGRGLASGWHTILTAVNLYTRLLTAHPIEDHRRRSSEPNLCGGKMVQ